MANSDDPPFLNIGTEVSAKYRGAFCEATIKVAKKLVKCKISYTKGQTAMVNNDVVKGTLKVGSQVEVKQPDGQFLMATINKLTDQSTYTVVFDDGDERTLKRSSLCLKGARHFHESESLDNQPLTDPENFGAPVNLKKSGRKRRRFSPGSSQEDDSTSKRKCAYPPEFPVGKVVFLENDRRRSCWLPAVIVPAHYVMEESEMTSDTICLRSFKDGRFFAATKKELRDFSPDKEPLLSMLEGEIQAMYMCKPAIERATAYLDTGELPWDMDLFDKNSEHPRPLRPRDHTPSDKEDGPSSDDLAAERESFMSKYTKFMESKGSLPLRPPTIGQKDLDLFQLYKLVQENGGMDRVTQEMKWRSIYLQLSLPSMSNASFVITRSYKKNLYAFESFEKGKGAKPAKDSPNRQTRRRVPDNSDEEQQHTDNSDKITPKMTRNSKMEPKLRMEKVETPEKVEKPKPVLPKVEKVIRSEKPVKLTKQVAKETIPVKEPASEEDDVLSQSTEVKSEISDQESSAVDNSSSNGDDLLEESSGVVRCPGEYAENDHVLVWYGKGKSLRTYQAKIQGVEQSEEGRSYLVHYNGWNNRYNEWIEEMRLAGKIVGKYKPSRPHFSKKKNGRLNKAPFTPGPLGSATPPPIPSLADSPPSLPPSEVTPVQRSKVEEEPKDTPTRKTLQATNTKGPTPVGVVNNSGVRKPRVKKRKRSTQNEHQTDSCDTTPAEAIPNESISLDASQNTISPAERPVPNSSPKPAEPLSNPSVDPSWTDRASEPIEDPMDLDEAIEVKREENLSWESPRGSRNSSSSGHGSLTSSSSGVSELGEVEGTVTRDLGGLAAVAAAADALVCVEKIPGMITMKQQPNVDLTEVDPAEDGLAVLAAQASQSHPTFSTHHTHSTHGLSTVNSKVHTLRNPLNDSLIDPSSPLSNLPHPQDHTPTSDPILNVDTAAVLSSGHTNGKLSSSEKETTPPSDVCGRVRGKRKGSHSPEGKRKYYETDDQYEARKLARRAELNFRIDFTQLPEMSREERTALIQRKIRDLQSRWLELRSEVAYLERKKRRARRKERENARLQASQVQSTTAGPSASDVPLQPPVECH